MMDDEEETLIADDKPEGVAGESISISDAILDSGMDDTDQDKI